MVDKAKFWNKLADKYAKSQMRDVETYNKKLEKTREYLTEESQVFELGCGTGSTALLHAPFVKHIVATDISSRMLEIGQEKADAEGIGNVTFQEATIDSFEGENESFDAALALNILHLLEEPEAAIVKIRNMLKPGGVMVSSTICLGDGLPLWRLVIPFMQLVGKAPYVNNLKRQTLESYFESAGFEIVHRSDPSTKSAAFLIAKKV